MLMMPLLLTNWKLYANGGTTWLNMVPTLDFVDPSKTSLIVKESHHQDAIYSIF